MRTKIKKGIMVFLAMLLLCSTTAGMIGCGCDYKSEDYKIDRYTEDFVYRRYIGHIEIEGLTEVGKTKEVLVMPEMIDNRKVETCSKLESNRLKKLFIPEMLNIYMEDGFMYCRSLEKLICYKNVYPLSYPVQNNAKMSIKAYIRRGTCREDTENGSNIVESSVVGSIKCYFANVRFMKVNSKGEVGECCWIDDYEYGSRISFLPDDLEFVEWYKEPECINQWNFGLDTLPRRKVINGVEQYQETVLYGKL